MKTSSIVLYEFFFKLQFVCFYKHNIIFYENIFIYSVCFLLITKCRKENFILKTVNENNEETKMSRKTEIYFYLEVALSRFSTGDFFLKSDWLATFLEK